MGHAPPKRLDDVEDVLSAIRALAGISERGHGVFYLGRLPFLHFHIDAKAGTRWADAKDGATWGAKMPLPFGADQRQKAAFLREVVRRHRTRATGSTRVATTPRART